MTSPLLGELNGVLVWTSAGRFETLTAFYRETLQLPLRVDRPGHTSFEWPSGMRLTIGVHSSVGPPLTITPPLMLNFAVTDIAAAAAGLAERGVAFTRPPSPEPWGGWIATFADPDGNIMQLLQPAP